MNILTFDVEQWFHILDHPSSASPKEWVNKEYRLDKNMDRILTFLDEKNQKATFFVLGWVAKKYPHIVKRLDDLGYELATHSHMHQLAYTQTREEFSEDLKLSIESIENISGKKVTIYRVPGFSIKDENKWAFEEIYKAGIEIDCSVFPSSRNHGGFCEYNYAKPSLLKINGYTLKELPINLFTFFGRDLIFSGGGYFRFFPYWCIKYLTKNSDYVMTYFHPRDFDKDVPVPEGLSAVRRWKFKVGVESAFDKFKQYVNDFEFIDIAEADKSIDWENVKKIVV